MERISKTRIDLIVVDTQVNTEGFNDIYLAELKVGIGAKDGKSGMLDHVNKTHEIISNDKACIDLVRASEDHGKVHLIERIDSRHGMHVLDYAEQIGLGCLQYELVELK